MTALKGEREVKDSRSYVKRLREGIGPTGTVNRAYRIWTNTQLVNNAAAICDLIEAATLEPGAIDPSDCESLGGYFAQVQTALAALKGN